MKVTIGVNEAQTRQLIQKQLNNISKGLKITIGGDFSNNGGQNATKNVKTTKFSEFVDGDVSKRAMSQATALKTKEELRKKQEQTHKAQLQREEQEKKNAYNESKRAEEAAERAKKKAEAEKKQAQITQKQIQAHSNQLAGMGGNADFRRYANGNIKGSEEAYKKYIQAVNEARIAEKAMNADKTGNIQLQQTFIDKVNAARNAQQQLNAVFNNSTAMDKQSLSYNKVIARITEYQAKFKDTLKNTPALAAQLEELNRQLAGGTFVGTESDAQNRFVQLTNDIRKAGGEAETLGQKIRRIFGEKLGYGIIASAAMMARRAVRELYTNVVELDNAVVNLQIATGKNREETKELVDTYSDLGRELGATTKEVANAADTWLNKIGLLYRDIQL